MQGTRSRITSKAFLLLPFTNAEVAQTDTSYLAPFLAADTYLYNGFSDCNSNRWPRLNLVWQVCFDFFLNDQQQRYYQPKWLESTLSVACHYLMPNDRVCDGNCSSSLSKPFRRSQCFWNAKELVFLVFGAFLIPRLKSFSFGDLEIKFWL